MNLTTDGLVAIIGSVYMVIYVYLFAMFIVTRGRHKIRHKSRTRSPREPRD